MSKHLHIAALLVCAFLAIAVLAMAVNNSQGGLNLMSKLLSRNIVVVDCEVFCNDWIVVLLDLRKHQATIIKNDPQSLLKFYMDHKNSVYCGFNIKHYDQYILKFLILAALDNKRSQNPKELNDFIIKQGREGWEYNDGTSTSDSYFANAFNDISLTIYDVMQNFPMGTGLKKLEAFMGEAIDETSVNFDIDRKLTDEELETEANYCKADVINTAKIFILTLDDYKAQVALIEEFGLNVAKGFKATKPFLSAMALGAEQCSFDDEWEVTWPSEKLQLGKYAFVEEWFKSVIARHKSGDESQTDVTIDGKLMNLPKSYNANELSFIIGSMPVTVALGGLHGAVTNYFKEGHFLNLDVQSYYPSDMLLNEHLSRAVSDPRVFKNIYNKRIQLKVEASEAKKAGNKELADLKKAAQAPLKLVLNSTYGAMGFENNPLYDPRMMHSVCISGQLMLVDLMEKLDSKSELVQANTDGVLIRLTSGNEAEIMDIANNWMQRTGMILEAEHYTAVYQRDVNNYIAVSADGNIKAKGSEVKPKSTLDNDLPIINEAITAALVKGVTPRDYINNCNEFIKFQKIFTVTSNYECALHGDQRMANKVFRVFASTDKGDPCLYHKKCDIAEKNPGQIAKFADCPEHCFIDNSKIIGKAIPDKLDKEWYIALAEKKLEAFKNGTAANNKAANKELEIAKAVTVAATGAATPEEGALAAVKTIVTMIAKPKKA